MLFHIYIDNCRFNVSFYTIQNTYEDLPTVIMFISLGHLHHQFQWITYSSTKEGRFSNVSLSTWTILFFANSLK